LDDRTYIDDVVDYVVTGSKSVEEALSKSRKHYKANRYDFESDRPFLEDEIKKRFLPSASLPPERPQISQAESPDEVQFVKEEKEFRKTLTPEEKAIQDEHHSIPELLRLRRELQNLVTLIT
jgi:hypothetical protein